MKRFMFLLAALATLAFAAPTAAMDVDSAACNTNIVGDVRYDYTFVTNDGFDNNAQFSLDRARLGAVKSFDEGSGALVFQYKNGEMVVQYAYVEAFLIGNASSKLGLKVGRQETMFGLTKELDHFQPLAMGPIEEGVISEKQDGVAAVGTLGRVLYGALQYHNAVVVDEASTADNDWNAYAKLSPCQYFYVSSSFLQDIDSIDFMANVIGTEVGPVTASIEHLSAGDSFSFDFGDRRDNFSATLGVAVGNTRKVQLLGRADWPEAGKAEYIAGVNWIFRDSVFLQANTQLNPEQNSLETADNIVKFRAVVLFD